LSQHHPTSGSDERPVGLPDASPNFRGTVLANSDRDLLSLIDIDYQ
jgi:hypothetical protein